MEPQKNAPLTTKAVPTIELATRIVRPLVDEFISSHKSAIVTGAIAVGATAIASLPQLRDWIQESVRSDFLLIIAISLIGVSAAAAWRIRSLGGASPTFDPLRRERRNWLIPHFGVWWKVSAQSGYVEEFPYCSCCDLRQQLVLSYDNTGGPSDFHCPKTKTSYRLFNGRYEVGLEHALEYVRTGYRPGRQLCESVKENADYIRSQTPDISDSDLVKEVLRASPFSSFPVLVKWKLRRHFRTADDLATHFMAWGDRYVQYAW